MRLLTLVDQLFLLLESRTQPMHVGGLFLFEPPKDAGHDFVKTLMEQMQTSTTPPSFPFNQVLDRLLFWQKDDNFDLTQHFRHIALPQPARIRELLAYVSVEHGKLLNKSNPMWECHIIEGIEPETENQPQRFALYFKIHHSLVDGIAAMRLVKKSLSQSPDEQMMLPLWSLLTRHRNQIDAILPINKPIKQIIKEQLGTIKPVANELIKTLSIQKIKDPHFINTLQAPMCMLNQRITPSRRLSTQSYDLSTFKRIAEGWQVSVNDVVLAVCAGAVRRYLLQNDALPKKPLIAFVPISLRTDNSASGNQVSFLLANLGTHLHDPIDRLKVINGSMREGKERFGRMNQAQVINYSAIAYAWAGLNLLTNLYPKKQAFNLIISNVPGSKQALYWNGAKLKALYPASILLNGQAMNITLATYIDKVEFGIMACNDVLPHTQDMLKYIADELCLLDGITKDHKAGACP